MTVKVEIDDRLATVTINDRLISTQNYNSGSLDGNLM